LADFMEFQSELRLVPEGEIDQAALAKATGIDCAGGGRGRTEHLSIVNQIMQFGKISGRASKPILPMPRSPVATAFVALAVDSDLFEKKKELESVPLLRKSGACAGARRKTALSIPEISSAPGSRNIPSSSVDLMRFRHTGKRFARIARQIVASSPG